VPQPGTRWFGTTVHYGKQLGARMDIRRSVARDLTRDGLPVEHFQLGYHPGWDCWGRDESATRALDVLYLGRHDDRRAHILAGYTETLQRRSVRLLTPPDAPNSTARPDYLLGSDRWAALRDARTLLNVHRTKASRLEWPRVLESICNGCVVVSEHSIDLDPLVPGEHLVLGAAENLALLGAGLLDDEPRLAEMRLRAYDFVRSELSMRPSAQRLLAMAENLAQRPRRTGRDRLPAPEPPDPASGPAAPAGPAADPLVPVRAALKQISIDALELRRRVKALELGISWPEARRSPAVVAQAPAYGQSAPRVTVAVPLYNHHSEIMEALASVAASEYAYYEVVVLDDGSTDGSTESVRRFIAEHPWLPLVLLRHAVNCGLGRARNAIVERARGEFVFMLDADNQIYPAALGRLVDALDANTDAMFAYPMLCVFESGEPTDILSRHAWDPQLLNDGNFVDAMALIRRDQLREVGGYAEDARLVGWEDYDLWCRAAESGRHGVHVPEILAGYRRSEGSLLSLTELDTTAARSLIAARAPTVFGSADSPAHLATTLL
jgi:hypothetical protein